MKKALSLMLALIMVLAAFAVFTVSTSADDIYEFADGVLTLKGDFDGGYSSGIKRDTYPWGLNEDTTGKTEKGGANLRSQITKVVVTDDVTMIGKYAFVNCVNLKEVVLGKNTTALGNSAFQGCTSLESITFGTALKTAGNNIVKDCTSLKTITLVDQNKAMFYEALQQGTGNVGTAEKPTPFDTAEYILTGNTKPVAPETIERLNIAPMYGNIENWPGSTSAPEDARFGKEDNGQYQYYDYTDENGTKYLGSRTLFIVGGINADYQNKMKGDEPLAYLRVCVTDETTGKIYLIDHYLFNYSQGREFYGDSFIRLSLVDYGVPVDNTHTYTLSLEIYNPDPEDPFVYASGKSDVGAFQAGSNQLFVLNNAIVLDPLPNAGLAVEVDHDPINVAAADPYVLESIQPYENGMENWGDSPNKGDQEKVTQILFVPTPWDTTIFKVGNEVTVTMNDGETEATFTLPIATTYNAGDWGIVRLEPCLMTTPWVPVKDKEYTATFAFDDGTGHQVSATAVDDDGNPAIYVINEDPVDPTAISGSVSGTFAGKDGAQLTWTIDDATKTLTISGTGAMEDIAHKADAPWAAYAGVLEALVVSDGVTRVGKNTASGTTIKTATFGKDVKEIAMDAIAYCENLETITFGGPIETIGQGTVYGSDNIKTVNLNGQTVEEFLTVASAKNYNDGYKNAEFTVDGKPATTVVPTTVSPFANGMENWPGSPNKGDEDAATQILFCPSPWDNDIYKNYVGKMVTVTMHSAEYGDETFTAPVATVYPGGTWGILRLEPCLLETPWVPEKDVVYTATFTFENKDGETVTVESSDTYLLNVDPIVPSAGSDPTPTPTTETPTPTPVEPTTIGKYGTGMENWPGSPNKGDEDAVTQILLCPAPWDNDFYKASVGKMVTITMTSAEYGDETFTAPIATVYPGGTWGILRIEPCLLETPWVPEKDVEYTATITLETPNGVETVVSGETFTLGVDPIVPAPKPVVEPVQLGGYIKAAGNSIEMFGDQYVLAYDFDVAPVVSKDFWDNKQDYTFTVTFYDEDGNVIATVEEEPVKCASWGPTDNNLYFAFPFVPEFESGYGMKVEVVAKDGSVSYWVEELYNGGNGGATMTFVPITEDVEGTFTGKNGETLTWKIKAENRTLYISGEGEMDDFASPDETPWGVFGGALAAVRVRKGITRVGKNTASRTGITEAFFEEGITELGMDAVAYCSNLKVVYLPSTLAMIKQGTVYASNAIEKAYYAGTEADFAAKFLNEDGSRNTATVGTYNDNILNNIECNVKVPAGDNTAILVVLALVALFGTAVVVSKKVFSK